MQPIQELIQAELLRRKKNNKSYSLRAFAQLLDIPPGRLSEIISGKRVATAAVQQKILKQLGATDIKNFLDVSVTKNFKFNERKDYHFVPDETFSVLADWYHFAILALMDTASFKNDAKWIAKRLNISVFEATSAVAKLLNVGLIENKKGKLVKTNKNLTTSSDIESMALRESHKQSLKQAERALDEVQIDLRDITSITMAIDIKKIAIAKKMIKEFRLKMSDFLESGPQTEVYNLNVQLVPVTKKGDL